MTTSHDWIGSVFGDVPPAAIEDITSRLSVVHVARGKSIFCSGDPAEAMYAIELGKVKLSRRADEIHHRRESLLSVIAEGQVFGELSLLSPGPRTTTASAVTACKLLRLDGKDLEELLDLHPALARGMLHKLAHRLRYATEFASEMVLNDVQGRTCHVLMHLAELFGEDTPEGVVVRHGLTQQEIAHMVGASRESVNKVLMDLTDSNVIQLSHRVVTIVDGNALHARADRVFSNTE